MLVLLNPIGNALTAQAKNVENGTFRGGEIVTLGSSARETLAAVGTANSASLTGVLTFSTPTVTLTDPTNVASANGGPFSPAWVGYSVTITGATAPANNGTFFITGATTNSLTYTNASGVAQAANVNWTIKSPVADANSNIIAKDYLSQAWVGSTATQQVGFAGASPLVTRTVASTSTKLYIVDAGSVGYKGANGYGTQFGLWTGGMAGLTRGETLAGPTSDQSNGRLALYRSGEFGVTLDSVAANLVPPTGNAPWLTGGGSLQPGQPLYAKVSGTLGLSGQLTADPTGNVEVGTFKYFATKQGFVNTVPARSSSKPYDQLYMIVLDFGAV